MASIITATTTSGLTQSADNSGVLQLASGTGNLVTVPSVTGTAMVSGNMPAFSVYGTGGNQSITTNTWTKAQLNAEEFDTANCFDSTTNYRYTPNVAGYYQINGTIYFTGTATLRGIVAIYKNGTLWKMGNYMVPYNSGSGVMNVAILMYMNGSTDYIELYGFVGATSPQFERDQTQVYMTGALVRAA
jgi:hypothetical protein